MNYPLIILGAGASYDCIDQEQHLQGPYRDTDLLQYRPPLLKDLFNPSRFGEFLIKYPEAAVLASDADGVKDFEEYLTKVQEKLAPLNADRYKQLISLRFYLCELFTRITEKYYRPKNYFRKIITNIKDNGGNACFVDFNYDLLLETNFPEIRYSPNIDSYITNKIKIIKIHGACNWFYETNSFQGERPNSTALEIFNMYAENLVKFANSDRKDKNIVVRELSANPSWNYKETVENRTGANFYLPALAIPVTTKVDYVCPGKHMEELGKELETIDRILIIGWKANDKHLIKLLVDKIKKPTNVTIVSKTSTTDVLRKLQTNTYLTFNPLSIGFTDFVKSEHLDKFFNS